MYCPACGSNVSNEADYCPICGENLAKARNLLDETTKEESIIDSKLNLDFYLEGDSSTLSVNLNTVHKFILKVKNKGSNPINNVNIKLSSPSYLELLTNLIKFEKIEGNSTKSAPIRLIQKEEGVFILSAQLQSNIGHPLSDSFELQSETPSSIEIEDIPEQPTKKTYAYTQRKSGSSDQVVAVLVIFGLIGGILMISGGVSFAVGGLPFQIGISLLVVGFIFLSIGTKGRCLIIPFACGDCDCDCDC